MHNAPKKLLLEELLPTEEMVNQTFNLKMDIAKCFLFLHFFLKNKWSPILGEIKMNLFSSFYRISTRSLLVTKERFYLKQHTIPST